MVQLFLNGELASLPEEQKFTVTKTNNIVAKDNSFTYNISLSLLNPINARIFGPINRAEIIYDDTQIDAQIIIDGRTIIKGYATILSVTDKIVEIQLISKDFSKYGKWKDKYIDEIDIGRLIDFDTLLWEHHDPDAGYESGWGGLDKFNSDDFVVDWEIEKTMGHEVAEGAASASQDHLMDEETTYWDYAHIESCWSDYFSNRYDRNRPIYLYPIKVLNETYQDKPLIANGFYWETWAGMDTYMHPRWLKPHRYYWAGSVRVGIPSFDFSPQIALWYVVEMLFEKMGFIISKNIIRTESWFKKIIVTSGIVCSNLCEILPHWTVGEFIENLENFFQCKFVFNEGMLSIDYFAKDTVKGLKYTELDIIDRFNKTNNKDYTGVEVEETVNNYSYRLDINEWNKFDSVDKNVIDRCEFIPCKNDNEMITQITRYKKKNAIYTVGNEWYICKEDKPYFFNVFRDKFYDQKNAIELKIKPVSLCPEKIKDSDTIYMVTQGGLFSKMFDIEKAINGDLKTKSKEDCLYVAIHEGVKHTAEDYTEYLTTASTSYTKYNLGDDYQIESSLCLYDSDLNFQPKKSGIIRYSNKVAYTFYFVADDFPDINSIFIIKGKKFIAKSITIEVDGTTANKLYHGEFLRVIES